MLIDVQRQDGLAVVTLQKPESLNALCARMAGELLEALRRAADDASVRAVLITGGGRAFCAGSDLNAEVPGPPRSSSERGDVLLARWFDPLVREIRGFPKPVVIAVNGLAVGGGVGLALSGDVTLMAASAELRISFGRIGLVPDMGCTWQLVHRAGRARALGAAALGEPIPARTARDWGLVWDVVPDAELDAAARDLARRLGSGSGRALVETRLLMDAAVHRDLGEQLDAERRTQARLMDGPDFREGVAAFRERRAPRFQ